MPANASIIAPKKAFLYMIIHNNSATSVAILYKTFIVTDASEPIISKSSSYVFQIYLSMLKKSTDRKLRKNPLFPSCKYFEVNKEMRILHKSSIWNSIQFLFSFIRTFPPSKIEYVAVTR